MTGCTLFHVQYGPQKGRIIPRMTSTRVPSGHTVHH